MTSMVRASGLRGYEALMHSLGADPSALLRRYRVSSKLLNDGSALLPLRTAVQLIEGGANLTQCLDFGLRLANYQDISVLGPVSIAMQNAPTVASALEIFSRYIFVHSPGMMISVLAHSTQIAGAAELRFELNVPGMTATRQTYDVCLGDIHRMLEILTGKPYVLRVVTLPHTPIAPISTYQKFFGAPVRFAQAYGGLHIAPETLALDVQSRNPELREIAVNYLAANFGNPDRSVASRVRLALQNALSTSSGSKSEIATMLSMHPRTLQRHLQSEKTCFEDLREATKKEISLRYLRETRMPFSQLASLLGYAEQSVFTRACRRWFGLTPSEIRHRDASDHGNIT